mmetsp:Transcript_28965/g.74904  ORF Transcript_28965/g.74904 Transcript_28965/m.74904 type:complete len:133 (+) Transcript_28965:537-935(+)
MPTAALPACSLKRVKKDTHPDNTNTLNCGSPTRDHERLQPAKTTSASARGSCTDPMPHTFTCCLHTCRPAAHTPTGCSGFRGIVVCHDKAQRPPASCLFRDISTPQQAPCLLSVQEHQHASAGPLPHTYVEI